MQAASKFKDLKWQFVGPTNISGRVTDVAVVTPKGKAYTIYVASASGGVWKTENEGTTWTPIFENMVTAAVGDIALAPSDQNIVWVGTGEHNIFRSSQAGVGVFKSADRGKTWAHMGLADTNTIARIVVHPTNPDIVYVAAGGHEWTKNADRGVYKTTDGGKTWDKILYANDETGAYDLVMDPRSSDTLYASMWQRTRQKWNDPRTFPGHTGSGLFKTTDGGKTWTPINAGLPTVEFRGRIGIDICLTKPDTLYALVDNYELRETTQAELDSVRGYYDPGKGFIKGATVYRSDDAGTTWTQTSGLTPQQKGFMERHSGTYGWVFGQIRVDPNDPNTSYIMGVPFSVSTDGGKTYKTVRSPGGDNHALWIDPANSSYMVKGFDQGVAVTYDKGKNWRYFREELNLCQFFNLNYDMATPFRVYGSMQDHGSFRGKVDLSAGRDKIPASGIRERPGRRGFEPLHRPDQPRYRLLGRLLRHDLPGRVRQARALSRRPVPKGAPARPLRERAASAGPVAGPVHPLAAQPEHPLPRHAVRLPVPRPRRHLGEDQPRPDHERSGDPRRHPLPDALHHLRVARQVRPPLRRDRRRPALGDQGRRQGLDRDHGRTGPRQVDVAGRRVRL